MVLTAREELLNTAEELAGLGSWTLDLASKRCEWSDGMYRIHGLPPQSETPGPELLLSFVHPDDRADMERFLRRLCDDAASLEGEPIEMRYRVCRRDGTVREIRSRGRVERVDGDRRWTGVQQDVSDELMSERELHAYYAVGQALRDWESFEEGVVVLLRRLSTALEYQYSGIWTLDPATKELVCRAVWSEPELDGAEWEVATRAIRVPPGKGLTGRAWATGRPVVAADIEADPDVQRKDLGRARGIRSVLVLPAVHKTGTVAVLAFSTTERREPSPRLLRTLTGIGAELGRFLHRRRGQLSPSPLSARELEVLGLAAEGLSGPQIAERLIVSPSTIKTHFENIYEKLGIGDRAGAVAYALRIGLIS